MTTKIPADKDWEFLLSCLKHTNVKPDFAEVAKELGLKSADTAYKRHWSIMKKHGLAGNTGKGRKPTITAASKPATTYATTPKKRSCQPASKSTYKEEDSEEDDAGGFKPKPSENGSDEKAANGSDADVEETPTKKAKLEEEN